MSAEPDPPASAGPVAKRATARRLVRRVRRELTDGRAWRTAGTAEYAYTTEAIRFLRGEWALRVSIAFLAMMMLPLALVMQFNPMGPHGVLPRTIHLGAAVIGFVLGIRWVVGAWPTVREAVWFLLGADALIGIAVSVLSEPTARICGAIHLAMLGMFAAFLLGWRILLVHCVYSLVLIAGLTGYSILAEGRSLLDLYVYTTPAITTVVGLPVVIQVVVETGRYGITRVSREWYTDVLTGVHNRRGMSFAVRRAALRVGSDDIMLVGALDLDDFKRYNDSHGHTAGDELLVDVARRLMAVPRLVVGRNGGDEFGLFAVRADRDDAARVLEELRDLVQRHGDGDRRIRGSLGVVIARGRDRDRLGQLAVEADEALYQAKRSPTTAVVVRNPLML